MYYECFIITLVKELRLQMFRQEPAMSAQYEWQVTTKNEYYDNIALLYLETGRCRYPSISFVCFYLCIAVVIFIDYSDMGKMMDINTDKC